jgi:hypothetical protein
MRIAGESNEITRVTTSLSGGSFAARNGRGSNNLKPGELGRCEGDVEGQPLTSQPAPGTGSTVS